MYLWPREIQNIVEGVLQAENPVRYLERRKDDPWAQEIIFLLFDGSQTTNFREISHEFCERKYNIVNLGCYEKTIVLRASAFLEGREEMPIKTEYLVNLDSNIASFLPQILRKTQVEEGFFAFLKYIKEWNLNLSMLPYVLEDSLNATGMKNDARAYECLLGFFAFDRLTPQELEMLPCVPEADDYCCADHAWAEMKHTRFYQRGEERRVRSIYCFLLKVYMIQFQSKRSPENKLLELFRFVNEELGVYFEFGMLLAYWYFQKSQACVTQFFQKVQPKSKNKLKDIEGMAWDLFHLWDMPTEMAVLTRQDRAIVLQALATHDDALAKIAKLNPITRIAFYQREAQITYAFSVSDILLGNFTVEELLSLKEKRERLCASVDLMGLSAELERKLLAMF